MQDAQWVRRAVQWAVIGAPVAALIWLWLPFFNAIVLAAIISVLSHGMYRRSTERWKGVLGAKRQGMSDNLGAITVIVGLLVVVAIPLTIVSLLLTTQVNAFVHNLRAASPDADMAFSLDNIVAQISAALAPVLERLGGGDFSLEQWLESNRASVTSSLGKGAGAFAYMVGHAALMLVIALLTAFFMLRDGHRLHEPLMRFIPLPRKGVQSLLDRVRGTISAVFVGVLLVGAVQGTLAGFAYALAGIPNSLMWGAITIVLCWIPLLGAPLIYFPMSLLLISQGKPVHGVLLLAFGLGVVSQIDNLLKPLVIGARTQLHTMAVFFSLLGGVLVMGPIGLFVGPIVLTITLSLYDISCGEEQAAPA